MFFRKSLIAASILLGISSIAIADDNSGFVLDDINVDGLEGIQPDVVKSRIRFQKGSYITPEDTNQIINNLYGTGFFDSVDLYRKGRNLFVNVKERSIIAGFSFKGNKKIKKDDLDKFAKKHLFDPLEIKDYTLHYSPQNILNTAGGSEYKSRDLLKFIQLCINKGQWNGKQIISSSWIEKATTPKVNARTDADYGYLLWLKSFGKDKKYKSYYMSGNGGNKVLACPELDLTVVITATNYNNRNGHTYTDEMMNTFIIPAIKQLKE